MALGYPASYFAGTPVAALLAAMYSKKDVLVLARSGGGEEKWSPFARHQRAYSLLAAGPNGEILAPYVAPSGVIVNDELQFSAQLPLGQRRWFKSEYVRVLADRFQRGYCPKVIFSREVDLRHLKQVSSVLTSGKSSVALGVQDVRIGTIILEGAERLLFTDYRLREFVEWIGTFDQKGLKVLLYFSNPWSPFLDTLHAEYRAITLRLTPQFLQVNKESLCDGLTASSGNGDPTWVRVILDSPSDYEPHQQIELSQPSLPSGNMYVHWLEIERLLTKMGEGPRDRYWDRSIYHRIFKLARNSLSIISRPRDLVVGFPSPIDGAYLLRGVDALLDSGREIAKRLIGEQALQMGRLCNEIGSVLFELEALHGSRKALGTNATKLERIKTCLDENEGEVIVAPFVTEDIGPLRVQLVAQPTEGRVGVVGIETLSRRWFDRSNSVLILAGPLPWRYISELQRPYRKVIFVGYEGDQEAAIKDQIAQISMLTAEDYWKCLVSVKRVNTLVGESIRRIVDRAEVGLREIIAAMKIETKVPQGDTISVEQIVAALRERTHRTTRPKALDKLEEQLGAWVPQPEGRPSDPMDVVDIHGKDLDRPEILVRLALRINRSYVYRAPGAEEPAEAFPSEMKVGGVVAIIDDDERKTLLDLVVELYDIDQPVDAVLVDRWKAIVGAYLVRTPEPKRRHYDKYVEVCESGAVGSKMPRVYGTVCTWLRGEVIAPEDPSDLVALGIVIASDELQANASAIVAEADKVRRLHVQIGLRMNKIVRALLEGREIANLTYEELVLRSKIRLYEIAEFL